MNFRYKAVTQAGEKKEGIIEAVNKDLAIVALQRRGFVVTAVTEEGARKGLRQELHFLDHVPMKDVVILSRQISTLFEAQVSALKAFSLLATTVDNAILRKSLNAVCDDIQAGTSISNALGKHPTIFSEFYVNMVRAGEESGKLNQTFIYLADYLERQHELTSKTRNALVYPAFVVFVFITVMTMMLTLVIPKLTAIIIETGQNIPVYTKIVIGTSNFFVDYGFFILVLFLGFIGYLWWLSRSENGKTYLDNVKLSIPVVGPLLKKVYVSRVADNLDTMLTAGISIIRSIEITGAVVGSKVYSTILKDVAESVKGGSSLSDAMARHEHMPPIMVQMVKVGEETGSLGTILKTLARFYRREVDAAVDTMVSLIEPIMIVMLGLGVGILLASVLVPIYNIASSIN